LGWKAALVLGRIGQPSARSATMKFHLILLGLLAPLALSGCQRANNQYAEPVKERSDMLQIGQMAPEFTAKDQAGATVSLERLRGKSNVVLVFYPGDNTPGCTKQLCAIRDDWSEFQKRGVQVYGVNPAGAESHQSFIDKQNYPFPLIVDEGHKIAAAYGCKGLLMTTRTVYGIDKAGKIVFARRGMPANTDILAAFGEAAATE
jgi:peroxiredoxin Q/BCP